MKRIQCQVTLKPEVKEQAWEIFRKNGQKFSTVVEVYLEKIIQENQNATTA